MRGSGFFELEVVELQNPAGRLANGDVCSDEKCSTYFRLCLKEYQSNVTVSSPCTYGNTSSPVLAGNSFTFVEPDKSNARLVLPFQFRWTVSDTPQLILARPTTCNHFPTACHTCRPYRTRYLLFEHVFFFRGRMCLGSEKKKLYVYTFNRPVIIGKFFDQKKWDEKKGFLYGCSIGGGSVATILKEEDFYFIYTVVYRE